MKSCSKKASKLDWLEERQGLSGKNYGRVKCSVWEKERLVFRRRHFWGSEQLSTPVTEIPTPVDKQLSVPVHSQKPHLTLTVSHRVAKDQTSSSHLAENTVLLGRWQIRHVLGDCASQDLHKVLAVHVVEGLGSNPCQQRPHLTYTVEGQHLAKDGTRVSLALGLLPPRPTGPVCMSGIRHTLRDLLGALLCHSNP